VTWQLKTTWLKVTPSFQDIHPLGNSNDFWKRTFFYFVLEIKQIRLNQPHQANRYKCPVLTFEDGCQLRIEVIVVANYLVPTSDSDVFEAMNNNYKRHCKTIYRNKVLVDATMIFISRLCSPFTLPPKHRTLASAPGQVRLDIHLRLPREVAMPAGKGNVLLRKAFVSFCELERILRRSQRRSGSYF
jgi:hypothetical protein